MMIAAFAVAAALAAGVVLEVLDVLRSRVHQLTDDHVGRLDPLVRDVGDEVYALGPDRLLDRGRTGAGAGPGAHVEQRHERGQCQRGERDLERGADELAAGQLALLDAGMEVAEDLLAVVGGRDGRVALLGDLVVAHEQACPLHGTDADQQDGDATQQTEPDVLRLGVKVGEVDRPGLGHEEVDGDEGECQERDDAEAGRDLTLGATGGVCVDIGPALDVLRDARVVDRVGAGDLEIGAHRARAPFEAIQRAKPDQASDTQEPGGEALGHRADAAERVPAGVGGLVELTEVGDHRPHVVVRQLRRGEDRHLVRARAQRLPDLLRS